MSMSTWTQYIAMDDALPERRLLEAIESLSDWDDDFAIGEPRAAQSFADIEDPE